MAKKIVETAAIQPEIKTGRVKVKALRHLMCVGYGYFEGAELEISEQLAEQWVEMGLVRKC